MLQYKNSIAEVIRNNFRTLYDDIAVTFDDATLTYGDLELGCNYFSSYLDINNIPEQEMIIVCLEKSEHILFFVLGLLLSNRILIPVHHGIPGDRLKFIINDSKSKYIISSRERFDSFDLSVFDPSLVCIESESIVAKIMEAGRKPCYTAPSIRRSDIAYVNYTSGSMGNPKGVIIGHGGLLDKYYAWEKLYELKTVVKNHLQIAKFGFDVFIGDVIKAIGSGGVLLICREDQVLDPEWVCNKIETAEVDYVEVVPALLRLIVEYAEVRAQPLSTLKVLNCGSDHLSLAEYAKAKRALQPEKLFNTYGLTECTIENTYFFDELCDLKKLTSLPIGVPVAGDIISIVDSNMQPVTDGTLGEIVICGSCVAHGYLGLDELTSQRFFKIDSTKLSCMRTGDLGLINPFGLIELRGRLDDQLKINGNRIEPIEIESVLNGYPGISTAIVGKLKSKKNLVAYICVIRGQEISSEKCLDYCGASLPSYMLPTEFVFVSEFPLNNNGKIDRKRIFEGEFFMEVNRRKKQPHKLFQCNGRDEIMDGLDDLGINVFEVVNAFVKPSEDIGILIVGSIADGVATEVSDLDLLVIVDGDSPFKKGISAMYGQPVYFENFPENNYATADFIYKGLEINIDFKYKNTSSMKSIEPGSQKFHNGFLLIARLASGLVIYNQELVGRWRVLYSINSEIDHKLISLFVDSLKDLEDMKQAIGSKPELSFYLGISITDGLMRALLICNGYLGQGSKWLRAVSGIIENKGKNAELLTRGRKLLFPTVFDDRDRQREYFDRVLSFSREVDRVLRDTAGVGDVLDYMVADLDLLH